MAPVPPSLKQRDRRLRRELDAALQLSQALSQHVDVDELVERALRTALDVVGAESGSVLLANPESRKLIFRHVIGRKAAVLRGRSIGWDEGIAGIVFSSAKPYVTGDASRDRRHLASVDASIGYKTRDLIALPLKQAKGEPVGVMEVMNKRKGRLGNEDLGILTIISALTAAAVEQARLFENVKLAEVSRVVGDIGHDIGNLLTPVIMGVRMLQIDLGGVFNDLPAVAPEKAQQTKELCDKVMALMAGNMRRVQDMVREISDCVKGLRSAPRFAECQIGDVAGSVLKTLHMVAQERGIALLGEGLEGLPSIQADERRLYVAFYNLVNNAIPEVSPGGSITVRGRADIKGGLVHLSVADTGKGMPPEVRDSLFTERAISRKPGGTGLGTRIVKDVVDAHRGTIMVESKEGHGTTFHLSLPIEHPSA